MTSLPKYEVIITWPVRDSAYVARAPELPGCTAHGPSYEAALASIQAAMHLWIDTAVADGTPIPRPAEYVAST